ncbi:MAG: protein phosphatase 2C domain-containing protein [Burkholderiaceae bacterium]
MNYTLFQDTRPGKRPYNEDRLGCWQREGSLLLAVADGMGGHAHGEVAAQITVDHLGQAFETAAKPTLAAPERFLDTAVLDAHAQILEQARLRRLGDSPRTTVVACAVQDGRAWWTHVGDSRLYLIRKGRVASRTRDHTYVQQLVDSGRIREEAAENHPDRNRVMRCLGGPQAPAIEPSQSMPLEKDDVLLLCSDGLWGPLTQRQILIGLIGRDPALALPELIALAEARGGARCDNISVVAMHWQGLESPAASRN